MSTEKEKKGGGFFDIIKSTFLHEEEVDPPQAEGDRVASVPSRPPIAPPVPPAPSGDPEVIRRIDDQATSRLQAPVESVAGTYAEFMASMDALSDAVPDVGARQRAVIKLMTAKKIPLTKILSDLDACIGALEAEGRKFRSESEKHVEEKVGSLRRQAEELGSAISLKESQVSALESEIAALHTSMNVKNQEVNESLNHASLVQQRFKAIYDGTHSAMVAQRKQVSDLIDKEKPQ